jgi:phage terminase small subunit
MAKGGARARSGPIARSAQEQQRVGGKVRARNLVTRTPGTVGTVDPPPHLDAVEREQWDYYAPLLLSAGRLTLEARDTLAKYCTALARVVAIKAQMAEPEYRDILITTSVDSAGTEHVNAKPHPLLVLLRQWLMVARSYEADLLLNPAAAIRVPQAEADDSEPATVHDFYGPKAVG